MQGFQYVWLMGLAVSSYLSPVAFAESSPSQIQAQAAAAIQRGLVFQEQANVGATWRAMRDLHSRLEYRAQRNQQIANAQYRRDLYVQAAESLVASPELAQIPPMPDAGGDWVYAYQSVANGILPGINYQAVYPNSAVIIGGTEKIAKNLQDSMRYIAWYRSQLEEKCAEPKGDEGSQHLKRLIDHFVEKIDAARPKPKVRFSGTLNGNEQNKFQLPVESLFDIIRAINGFFRYKYEAFSQEAERFAPADFHLLHALLKTATIYGANPPATLFKTLPDDIKDAKAGWKGDAFAAINSWNLHLRNEKKQRLCSLQVPVKLAPPPVDAGPKESEYWPPKAGFENKDLDHAEPWYQYQGAWYSESMLKAKLKGDYIKTKQVAPVEGAEVHAAEKPAETSPRAHGN